MWKIISGLKKMIKVDFFHAVLAFACSRLTNIGLRVGSGAFNWRLKAPVACGLPLLLCLCALSAGGCSTLGTPSLSDQLQALPVADRDRVYPVFVNSPLDVPQIGRLADVASYFRDNGFINSAFLYRSSGSELAAMSRDIKRREPDARIAFIGWSGASLWIWDALTELSQSGESLDLVVYLDSNWIKTRVAEHGHPANFGRAVLIYRNDNPPVDGVPNSVARRVPTDRHLAVAAHPGTIEFLGEELIRLTVLMRK
ncbi:MAG: hypothetical protein GWP58_08310 [Gammaproteobacteria bacterium]|jgi:hypothetical protein|nr:hypothetical protein [Gammaproteobacteria bacterium]